MLGLKPDKAFREYTEEELKAFWQAMVERAEADQKDAGVLYTVFRLGMVKFAIEAKSCSCVVPFNQIMPLPNLPSHILGVTSVRGSPVSVTDLRYLAGLGSSIIKKNAQLVLIKDDGEETALLVDWVYNVNSLDVASAAEPGPDVEIPARKGLYEGAVQVDGEEILLLSAKACLKAADYGD